MIFNKHARAVRDAKKLAGLLMQMGIPYAVELNNVIVAASSDGQKLLAMIHEGAPMEEPLILFDDSGENARYTAARSVITFEAFEGNVWTFQDITDLQKNLDDVDGRARHLAADKRVLVEVLNNFSFPVWMQSEAQQVFFTNKKYEELYPNGLPSAVKDIAREGARGKDFLVRTTPAIVQGERRHLEVKVQPVGHGRAVAWTADRTEMMEEIGARSRMLAAQKTLLEQLQTAVATFDETQSLTFYNGAYAKLWDLGEAYLNGKPKMGEILERLRTARYLPEQADFKAYKADILARFTGLLAPLEEMMYLPDGRTLRLLTVPNPDGGLLVTYEDVTSTLQLESSVNTLLAVQRETLDNMTEAIAVYGSDGRLKLWNPQFAQLWGFYPEELNSNPHISHLIDRKSERFATETRSEMRQLCLSMTLQRENKLGRFVFEDARQINFMAVPLPDGATLIAYDNVTDAYRVEQALRDRALALEAAEQLKIDFLANVSYQLRTPLNAITGFAELLEHQYFGALNEKQKEYAHGITEAGQRLLALIDDILDLATIEAGYMEMHKDIIDVSAMVAGIYHLTEDWVRKAQHMFTLDMGEDLGTIYGDERRLKQVIINLIRNAIAYTPQNGTIEIAAQRMDGQIIISVKDNGVGIAPADQERIFQSFAKVEANPMNQNSGAGLGLSLVKAITLLHDGQLHLNSEVGQGTTISLGFPTMD